MANASDIIDRFGGQSALARLLNKQQSTIHHWYFNGIPAKWQGIILELARENRIQLAAEDFFSTLEIVQEKYDNQDIPRATHQGKLTIADKIIDCAVLEDGTRVITQTSFLKALNRSIRPVSGQGAASSSFEKVPAFLAPKNLKPYISDELEKSMEPIIFKPLVGGYRGRAFGYSAQIIPLVCGVYLDAEKAGKLLATQYNMLEAAKILIRGLATVGIIALVDEATGYQEARDRGELNRILEAYIAKELLPWTKKFPDEFYKQLFRLRGWGYSPFSVARPQYVGKLTNQLVYEKLPPGVLESLKEKNPITEKGWRRHRHHQFLTVDLGNPHLDRQIVAVITLMKISANWADFKRHFERAFPPEAGYQLDFEDIKQLEG